MAVLCLKGAFLSSEKRIDKLTAPSVAPALAETMRRIHEGESVSELFDER